MALDPTTVYVRDLPIGIEGGNVEQEINDVMLISLCQQYANIDPLDVSIQTTENLKGHPSSYAFIQLQNREEAEKLVNTINFIKLNKKPVHLILFDDEAQDIIRDEDGKSLVIRYLPKEIEVSDLYNIFKEYGDVIDCDMPQDDNEMSYVLYRKSESAKQAIKKLEGASLNGHKPIHIEYDHQNTFYNKFALPEENNHKSNHHHHHSKDYDDDDNNNNNYNDDIIIDSDSDDVNDDDDDNDNDSGAMSLSDSDMSDPQNESQINIALMKENELLKKENALLRAKIDDLEKQLQKYTKKHKNKHKE